MRYPLPSVPGSLCWGLSVINGAIQNMPPMVRSIWANLGDVCMKIDEFNHVPDTVQENSIELSAINAGI